ncbi:MAG TPA: hypothetical protein VD866_00335 [Urbifossiella sp.]|nr:hypothetical protein [Urbifossiella sp.]
MTALENGGRQRDDRIALPGQPTYTPSAGTAPPTLPDSRRPVTPKVAVGYTTW